MLLTRPPFGFISSLMFSKKEILLKYCTEIWHHFYTTETNLGKENQTFRQLKRIRWPFKPLNKLVNSTFKRIYKNKCFSHFSYKSTMCVEIGQNNGDMKERGTGFRVVWSSATSYCPSNNTETRVLRHTLFHISVIFEKEPRCKKKTKIKHENAKSVLWKFGSLK